MTETEQEDLDAQDVRNAAALSIPYTVRDVRALVDPSTGDVFGYCHIEYELPTGTLHEVEEFRHIGQVTLDDD